MSNKNDAMNNFQDAINKSSKKQEEDKKAAEKERKKQEQQEEFERKRKQNTPTKTEETTQEDDTRPQTEEEKEAQKAEDARHYNIYDDDDDYDDNEENDDNSNNPRNRRKNNNKDDDDDDDNSQDNNNDNQDNSKDTDSSTDTEKVDTDNTDQNSQIDDSEKSSKSSDKSGDTQSNGTETPDAETSTSGNTGASPARETKTAAGAETGTGTAKAGADTVSASAAEAGGGAAAEAASGNVIKRIAKKIISLLGGIKLWMAILIIALVIIAAIIVIGYAGFFINGVGLIREKLGKFADTIFTGFTGFFVGSDVAQVKDEQIYDVAQYLEDMGYDLVYSGFLDTNGKAVTKEVNEDGSETIKSGNKIIYQTKLNEETGKIEINKLESKYIKAYLAAENNTYMIANQNWTFTDIFFTPIADMDEWGTGMIHLENASSKVKIDRENKKMQIKYKGYVYQYDLDGWTGRYGKSFEFLLTLHVATQAPDFVYDVIKEFDTKVNIALRETEATIKLKMPDPNNEEELIEITEKNYASLGLSAEQWGAVYNYTKEPIKTFTPFITSVKNHWYKDLDFTDCYVVAENNPDSTEDDEAFTSTYQYVGLEKDENNDILSQIENLYVEEVRTEDIFQVKEPMVKKNELIKEMLLGGKEGEENTEKKYKYYIYNGSEIPEEGLEKDYIIKKMGLEDGTEKLNTRGFTYAFAILEAVHTEDAEYILRDLKELSKEIGIDLDETEGDKGGEEEIEPLVWPVEDYKPIVWDPIYDAQNPKVIIRHQAQGTVGFSKDLNVVMPANGEIVQITKEEERYNEENKTEGEQTSTRETSVGDAVKIKFTGTDRADLKDMYIYISGLKLDDSVSVGSTYSAEEVIGKTIESDIMIIMTDNRRKVVYNVDDYIVPEEWEPLEETDEIQDSQFKGDIFAEGGTMQGGTSNISWNGETITDEYSSGYNRVLSASEIATVLQNIDQYKDIIIAKSQQYGVPAEWIMAIIAEESGGNPNATNRDYPNMVGLMQLNSDYSEYTRSQLYNPEYNIDQGAKWLGQQLRSSNGQIYEALGRYGIGASNWSASKIMNGYSSNSILGRQEALRVNNNLNTSGNNGYIGRMEDWHNIIVKYYNFS